MEFPQIPIIQKDNTIEIILAYRRTRDSIFASWTTLACCALG